MHGLMTAVEMRATEALAMASGEVTGLALMERAGEGVVAAIAAMGPVGRGGPAVVLCGPGHNGGDGFVIARHLAAAGRDVTLFLFGEADALPQDARANALRWRQEGGAIGRIGSDEGGGGAAEAAIGGAGLVVDALFGIGLSRPMPPVLCALAADVARARRRGARVVAVDVPSGLCADSGRPLGTAFSADLTVTFHAEKLGHRLAEGPAHCGAVRVVDLGLSGPPAGVTLTQPGAADLRRLGKGSGHKYGHGHALILAGGAGHGGAARLAARGALRVGAGLVTLGVPPEAMAENAAQVNAVMLAPVPTADALGERLEDARIAAICIGPGLAPGRAGAALLRVCLRSGRPMVADAGAITIMAGEAGLRGAGHAGCVLTPHDAEFRRLFPDIAERLAEAPVAGPAFSRVDAARMAAVRSGSVVLLKGPDTVIAGPDGRCSVHSAAYEREAGWLATAGSGDVLAGFITGLMARGLGPFEAAQTGAWLHVECARAFGPGLIAEDLPDMLPAVYRAAGL